LSKTTKEEGKKERKKRKRKEKEKKKKKQVITGHRRHLLFRCITAQQPAHT